MWLFKHKSSLESASVLKGFTDWHSHILPGVDDGIPDMKSALQVLERYEQLGIREVWLTPHIMEDIPNATTALRQRFDELLSVYAGPLTLHLAAEYMLDAGFEERLNNDDLLCIGSTNNKTLLVETSYFSPPMDLYSTIAHISERGYQPLLAHPERYIYMDSSDYQRLREMEVRFQCNITSLTGVYGKDACRKFENFLDKGWIQVLGTDIHRLKSFNLAVARKCLSDKQKAMLGEIGLQYFQIHNDPL